MRVTAAVQKSWDTQHQILKGLCDLMTVNQEQKMSAREVAETLGVGYPVMTRAKLVFEEAGILDSRIAYMEGGKTGRTGYWTLKLDYNRAREALDKFHDAEALKPRSTNSRPQRVAKADATRNSTPQVETRAIVGPDADGSEVWSKLRSLRKDESQALIAAARQYVERGSLLDERLKELEAAGISVDRSAISFDRDERLETIALVLPYIDNLETRIENLTSTVDKYRADRQPYKDAAREWEVRYNRLREELDRKTREQVISSGAMVVNGER